MACASRGSLRYTSARASPGLAICHIAPAMEVAAAMMSTASRSDSHGCAVLTAVLIASTCARLTSLNARTDSGETLRSRFIGACASRSQNSGRLASERAIAAPIWCASRALARSAASVGPHEAHSWAVRRRKICSRVSK